MIGGKPLHDRCLLESRWLPRPAAMVLYRGPADESASTPLDVSILLSFSFEWEGGSGGGVGGRMKGMNRFDSIGSLNLIALQL